MFKFINLFISNKLSLFSGRSKFYVTAITTLLTLIVFSGNASANETTRLVKLNDTVEIRMSSLNSEENFVTISWRQKGKRSKTYLQTAAKLRHEGGLSFVNIFIEQGLLPDFKSECTAKTETVCSVAITDDFQYGQDSDQTMRYLVYHDQSNCPYQHRFITTATATKFGEAATDLATQAGNIGQNYLPMAQQAASTFNEVSGLAKSAFGDYLYSMNGGNTCG